MTSFICTTLRCIQRYAAGSRLNMPILVAPMAMQCMAHPHGESGVARAVKDLGAGMVLSTMSTTSLEDVAEAGGDDSFLMFQVYVSRRLWELCHIRSMRDLDMFPFELVQNENCCAGAFKTGCDGCHGPSC